ncbi:hypothetical protein BACCIP111895_03977 [Neobacillus rhizosphaerae]|uniref:Uncharacterized protein n=1 Tax=Neobacillus rhizosphaerae TaxID=2880965 RepID=A0ABM9EVT8_9BACI|nr:hypothetical protein BACCIP111895_03977 [Neobacillus rhizosphaerae]
MWTRFGLDVDKLMEKDTFFLKDTTLQVSYFF